MTCITTQSGGVETLLMAHGRDSGDHTKWYFIDGTGIVVTTQSGTLLMAQG